MSSNLLVPHWADGVTRADCRVDAVNGSVFTAVALSDNRRAMSDRYRVILSGQSGINADIGIASNAPLDTSGGKYIPAGSGKGPYKPSLNILRSGIAFDGSTRDDLIEGLECTLLNGTPANGNICHVSVGLWAGLLSGGNVAGSQIQYTGAYGLPGIASVTPGQPQLIAKLIMKNLGADAFANSVAKLYPSIKLVNKTAPYVLGTIFAIDTTPRERASGGGKILPIKFRASSVGGGLATIQMSEDSGSTWATFAVRNVDTGEPGTSANLEADGTTRYQIRELDAFLENSVFTVHPAVTTLGVDNCLCFNRRHVWIAPDSGGAAGTWNQTAVTLTQVGLGSGAINPAGGAILWVKWDVGALALLDQSPYPGDITGEYARTGEAGWLD